MITTFATSPEMVAPSFWTERAPITAINSGTVAGGRETAPGELVQRLPHFGGLSSVWLAKPKKLGGAGPSLGAFSWCQLGPEKVTDVSSAFWFPITNAPCGRRVIESTVAPHAPELAVCIGSPSYAALTKSLRTGSEGAAAGT